MTKKRGFLVALIALVIAAGIVGYFVWRATHYEEDTSLPSGQIPAAHGKTNLPPLDKGDSDWPCWRGSSQNSFSTIKGIRSDWPGGLKLLWKVDYLCQGHKANTWSAPVVQGSRLVVPGRDIGEDYVFCLDSRTGHLLWKGSYPAKPDFGYGPGARATPCIDEERVYTFGRSGDLVCWSMFDGKKLWQKNVTKEGGVIPQWGFSSSPLVHKDNVLVQGKGALGIAFNKHTGKVSWKSVKEGPSGYATPVVVSIDGKTQVLIFYGSGLSGVNPEDGTELWNIPWETRYKVNATTPAVQGDLVFITSYYDMGCKALKIVGSSVKELWKSEVISAHHSDGIILEGYLYSYSGKGSSKRGEFKCVELKTGAEKWSTKEVGNGTTIYVDGFLVNLDYRGNLHLIKPGHERFIKVSEFRNAIPDVKQMCWTAPVAANGRLYLRYRQRLLCYDLMDR